MKDKEQKEIKGLHVQWVFIVIGSLFAVFLGVAVNALYDLLKIINSPFMILIIFGCGSLFFFGFFNFLFENLSELKSIPNLKVRTILWMFLKRFFKHKK